MTPFVEPDGFSPYYNELCQQCWWLEGQWVNANPQAYMYRFTLYPDGTYEHFLNSAEVENMLGVSVCIK